jgi:hypothetical protein
MKDAVILIYSYLARDVHKSVVREIYLADKLKNSFIDSTVQSYA